MNTAITEITSKTKGKEPVISIFHEWKSVDHSLTELQTLLRKASHEMGKDNIEHSALKSISLENQKVDGHKLGLDHSVHLADQHVVFYSQGDHFFPVNTGTRTKSGFTYGDQAMVLPLLLTQANPVNVLVINDERCQYYQATPDSHLTEIEVGGVPKSLLDFIQTEKVSDKRPEELGSKKLTLAHMEMSEGALNDSRKKMVKKALHCAKGLEAPIIVFASNRYKHFVEDMKKSEGSILAIKDFVPNQNSRGERFKAMEKELQEIYKKLDDGQLSKSNKEVRSVNNYSEVISLAMAGRLKALYLSKPFLEYHLGSFEDKANLEKLNSFIIEISERVPLSVIDSEKSLFFIESYKEDSQWAKMERSDKTIKYEAACEALWKEFVQSFQH